jgi:hypothetical protein
MSTEFIQVSNLCHFYKKKCFYEWKKRILEREFFVLFKLVKVDGIFRHSLTL